MSSLVYAVLVNWRNWQDTLAAVASLQVQSTRPRIVVVENASANDSEVQLRAKLPDGATLLVGDRNLGWAGGCNVGIRHALAAGADYVWLLNNDARADPGALSALIACAGSHPGAAAWGSIVYELDAPEVLWFAGGAIDFWLGITRHIGAGEHDRGQYRRVRPVDYLTGCSLMISRRAFERVGLLSEDYFLYYEDPDWCLAARRAGYRVMLVPDSKVWHRQGNSGREHDGLNPTHAYYDTRSNLYFIERHCRPWQRLSAYGWFAVRKLGKAAYWWLAAKPEGKVLLPQYTAAVGDYLRRRSGMRISSRPEMHRKPYQS